MKIKNKLTSWALFVVALVVVAGSLASGYLALHPQTAAASPPASGAIVPDIYGVAGSEYNKVIKSQANYQCKANIAGPGALGDGSSSDLYTFGIQNGYSGGNTTNRLLSSVQGASSAAKTVFGHIGDNKGVLLMEFTGANNNDDNNRACQNSMFLFRDPSSSSPTKFYGFWNTNFFSSGPGSAAKRLLFIEATINVSKKTVSFTIPASSGSGWPSSSRHGSFTLNVTDSQGIIKAGGTYFPSSGGGGSTSGGANCFEHNAASGSALGDCIKAAQDADFIDAAHISYAGDTYTATGWGNVSNKIVYKLTKPADKDRLSAGVPQIVMDTQKKELDINMDDKGSLSQINSIAWALNNARGASSQVDLELDNIDVGGNNEKGTIHALPAGMAEFATYYKKGDVVSLVFSQAGGNEKPYFGTYERVKGGNTFTLAGSNWGGKCSNLATFDFGSNDPSKPTTSYQGSTLVTQSVMPATWDLNANDGPCSVGKVHVVVALNSTADAPDSGDTTDTASSSPEINCSVTLFNPLSWFLCPLATALETVVSGLDNEINNYLDIKAGKGSYSTSPNASCGNDQWCSYYKSWSVVRNISLGLIAVFALVAVVSQALGFEIFDAYTIRKVLPRLLVAAIGITLSWPLMMFFINFTDDLGFGVRQLIYAPFSGTGMKVALGGGGQFVATFFAAGAIVALGFAGLLSFVATAALAAAVAFLVLTIRQMLIVMLVIFAPIAVACYVLPNTQKIWKMWWDSFSRGLLMFPIIAAFIAIGRVFAAVNSHGGSINQIISFTAYFAPYFLIPFTFRLAGGAISTIGGLVNDRSRGAFDRLKKYRGDKMSQNFHDMKTGNRFKSDNKVARAFNRTTETMAAIPSAGFNPARMGSRMQASMSQHSMLEAAEYGEKNGAFGAIKGNDDFLMAGIKGEGNDAKVRQYLQGLTDPSGNRVYSDTAVEQGVAAIRDARRSTNSEVFETAALMALPATGTAFKVQKDEHGNIIGGGAGEMHDMINHVAGSDRVKAARMLAQMRGGAGGARRFDINGGGFGAELGTMEAQYNGTMSTADATTTTIKQALNGQGGSYVAGARNSAVGAFAPVMLDELREKADKGNIVDFKQELAKIAGRYDAMSQVSPENAKQLSDGVLSQDLNGKTVRQWIEENRGDAHFLDMRKEFGMASRQGASQGAAAAQAAQMQQAMGQVQPPAIPPPQPPPGG